MLAVPGSSLKKLDGSVLVVLKPRLHYAIYAASNIRNRRSTSLAIRIAGCVRVYTGRRCAEVGVALPCEKEKRRSVVVGLGHGYYGAICSEQDG